VAQVTTRALPGGRTPLAIVLIVAVLAGVALGAYLDWYMWHPMSSIVASLLFAVLIVAGGIAALVPARPVRIVGLVLLAIAIGGFAGQAVGPRRPDTLHTDTGSQRLVLTAPTEFDAAGDASCGLVADGSQITVDPGEFGLARDAEAADFHYVHVAIGDMWDFGDPMARPDHVSVTIRVIPELLPDDGKPGEVEHTTDAASTVTLGPTTNAGGSISFANLLVIEPGRPPARSDLAGTISWTCGPVRTSPES
jgi:hypothetical protein